MKKINLGVIIIIALLLAVVHVATINAVKASVPESISITGICQDGRTYEVYLAYNGEEHSYSRTLEVVPCYGHDITLTVGTGSSVTQTMADACQSFVPWSKYVNDVLALNGWAELPNNVQPGFKFKAHVYTEY